MKPSLNWLFGFIPLTLALEHLGTISPPWIFFSAALAIVPIAALIVRCTEQLARHTGDAIGGLLNATFGNAPELIIALVALQAGYFDMVRASIVGAILANLLLALGFSFFLGGLRFHNQDFNAGVARVSSTMMFIAVLSLMIPSGVNRLADAGLLRQEHALNIGVALILLTLYVCYLLYMIKSHPEEFASAAHHDAGEDESAAPWPVWRAVASLIGASVLAAWMSEVLVGAAEGTGQALGMSQVFIGIVFLAIVGGAAESGSAIVMARRNKMDLSVGIALGSSMQIALFVAPVLVLVSPYIAPAPLELAFSRAELFLLFVSVLIGTLVCATGRANWFKGIQLIAMYAIMALALYLIPVGGR